MRLIFAFLFFTLSCVAAEKVTVNSEYVTWTLRNPYAFPARDAHSAFVLGDKLIVVAGENINRTALNDVWISSPPDSGIFAQVNVIKSFPPRADHSMVVLGNKLVIMAGQFNRTFLYNDVYSSTDLGTTWIQETASAPWAPRIGAMAVVLNNDIIMIGGYMATSNPKVHSSEVWKSSDGGKNWILIANNTFGGRADAQVNVIGNTLIMTGGENSPPNTFSDVLRSTDGGITWTVINSAAPFGNRFQHTMIPIGDQLLLTCGLKTNFTFFYNDVWVSRDQGVTWSLITSNANFKGRAHTDADVWVDAKGQYVMILTGGNNGGGEQMYIAKGLPLIITNPATRYVMSWGIIMMSMILTMLNI